MIPSELKQLNQWVCCWDNSKIPMRAWEKRGASSVSPDTWSDFATAEEAVSKGYYDYLGFVFNNNGIVGIDIDTGFEDGFLTPLCADIMNHCQSYTEKSRSGRGVHIFIKGTLPFHGKNNMNGVEIYQSRRFFIMTGHTLIFDRIIENQEAIDYIVDTYFQLPERDSKAQKPESYRIYSPIWEKPQNGRFPLTPHYPEIPAGGRNISLASLAGSLHQTGYDAREIYRILCQVNAGKCKPPLPDREVMTIVESITKYRR